MISKFLVIGALASVGISIGAPAMATTGPADVDCIVINQQTGKFIAEKKLTMNVVQNDEPIYTNKTGLSYTVSLTAFGDDKVTPQIDLVFLSVVKGGKIVAQTSTTLPLGSKMSFSIAADPTQETMFCSVKN